MARVRMRTKMLLTQTPLAVALLIVSVIALWTPTLSQIGPFGIFLIFAVVLGTSVVLSNRALAPLEMLSQDIHKINAPGSHLAVEAQGRDEMAQIKAALRTASNRLDEYRRRALADFLQTQAAQTVLDTLPDPIITFDAAGALSHVNRAAETRLGCRRVLPGNDLLQDVEARVRAVLERLCQHVLAGNGPYIPQGFRDALYITCPDGDHYFLPRATPVYDAQHRLTGATVMLQEVVRLGQFDKLDSDIVASLAHELRTPLTSLQVAVQLCLEQVVGPLTAKQLDLLKIAHQNCSRLQAAVDDIIDLSRISAHKAAKKQISSSDDSFDDTESS
jgi:two-component system, NtrC family, sensor histidine kinase KinB